LDLPSCSSLSLVGAMWTSSCRTQCCRRYSTQSTCTWTCPQLFVYRCTCGPDLYLPRPHLDLYKQIYIWICTGPAPGPAAQRTCQSIYSTLLHHLSIFLSVQLSQHTVILIQKHHAADAFVVHSRPLCSPNQYVATY
jgi:hypothetical protein